MSANASNKHWKIVIGVAWHFQNLVSGESKAHSCQQDAITIILMLQLQGVLGPRQNRAFRSSRRDYRTTTQATALIDQLGWELLFTRRLNSRLVLFYKGINGISVVSIPAGSFAAAY